MATEEEPDMIKVFEEMSDKFYALRQTRMRETSQEDMFTFLGDDVIMSMMVLLADMANYCDKQFIKLALLQSELYDKVKEEVKDGGQPTIGLKAFRKSSDEWKGKQS